METIITILIITALAALSNWISRKRQGDGEADAWGESPQNRPPSQDYPSEPHPARPADKLDWEGELRRLLRGEPPEEKPPPPPPLITPQRASPPVYAPAPERPQRTSPPPRERARELSPSPVDSKKGAVSPKEVASQAAERYKAAQAQLASRVRKVGDKKIKAVQVRDVPRTTRVAPSFADVHGALSLLQDRRKIRQAIIASVVLAPPKALDETAPL
jgi:hypothetical protein